MVKRILSMVGKEISGLHEAAYLLAGSTFLSLILALIRDRLLASSFGASTALDVYYAAFRVPDFIFVTAASLVSTSILVPLFLEKKEEGGEKRAIDSIFSAFFALIAAVSIAAYAAMPALMRWLFPELAGGEYGEELLGLSRILILSPLLLGLSNFFGSVTQMRGRFLVFAISPLLYNLGIISGILFLYPRFGLYGLGSGVAIGALLHVLIQVPFVIRDGLFPRLSRISDWTLIRRVSLLSVPRTITLSSQQITSLVLISFASILGAGSISIYTFASNLQSVPLSLIGVSYSAAAFPILARLMVEGRRQEFIDRVIQATRHIIFWSMPLVVLMIVLRAQIVRTVLGAGAFDWSDTRLTAAALALFVASAAAQGLVLLFVRAFYAEGHTKKPLLLNVASAAFTVVAAFVLLWAYKAHPVFAYFIESIMKTDGAGNSAVLMLPLAFSLGAIMNVFLHWRALSHEFSQFNRSMWRALFESVGSSLIGGFAAYQSLKVFDNVFDLTTAPGILLQGFCAGMVGIAATAVMLALLKNRELSQVFETLKRRVWKVDRSSLSEF